jgi:murein tripeptide amidase MpaA
MFESRFESGNLAAALKVNDQDYYLALQNDVNTGGNTQWFFFRISNTCAKTSIRFSMLNLCKPDSLYNEGMKVLVYSEKHAQNKDIGWHRSGHKISYYPNGIKKEGERNFRTHYTMTVTYDFDYEDDNVYFAYCYPYTYTEMVEELNAILADPIKQQYVQKKTLTETLAGNKCEVLTITSRQNPENIQQRKGVVLSARVHPGESVGSWMMKGALDFLVDTESIEAEYLRQNYVFKVVPMLNPDGVINGNYRCSLAGCDLNRRWKRPSKVLHPEIFATKQLCQ